MTAAEAVDFMVKNKIIHFRTPDGLEITLMPEALMAKTEPLPPDEKDDPTLDVVGVTGMSRRQQVELFGTVYEGDFPLKRA